MKITINFDENTQTASFEEGTIKDLFSVIMCGEKDFLSLILDGMVTIIANSKHQELLLSDLFKSLAIAKQDPVVLEELGMTANKEESDAVGEIIGNDLAALIKPTGDA